MIRKMLIGFIILIIILSLIQWISCNRLKTGVRVGGGVLSKALFFSGSFPDRMATIQVGNFDRDTDKEIAILGAMKGVILDVKTHQVKKVLNFKQSVGWRPEIVPLKNYGSIEIMRRGGGFEDVGLVNELGEFIWKFDKVGTRPEMVAGDLDGDGELEFYVADIDGLHRLDLKGREIWKVPAIRGEDYVTIYNPENNGKGLVISTGSDGKVRFRNSTGQLVREVTPEMEISGLELVKWVNRDYLLSYNGSSIILLDFDGRIFFNYALEKINEEAHFRIREMAIYAIRGVTVKFKPDKKPYLAVLTKFRAATGKAMLSIITPDKNLVYQEIINSSRGIAALPKPDGSESLLLGDGRRNVWIYEMGK